MAIIYFAGRPGSGKSYSMVRNIVINALKRERKVCTNIPLVLDELYATFPEADITLFRTEELLNYEGDFFKDKCPGGSVVILDEIGMVWPSGQRNDQAKEEHREFIQMARHRTGNGYSTEVVLAGQSTTDVAKWVRSKIERTYVLRNLGGLGAKKRYLLTVYEGCEDSERPRGSRELNRFQGKYDKDIYRYYESYSQSKDDGIEEIQEERQDNSDSLLNNKLFRYGVPAMVVMFIFGLMGIYNFVYSGEGFGEKKEQEEVNEETVKEVKNVVFEKVKREKRGENIEGRKGRRDKKGRRYFGGERNSDRWFITALVKGVNRISYNAVIEDGERRKIVKVNCEEEVEVRCLYKGKWIYMDDRIKREREERWVHMKRKVEDNSGGVGEIFKGSDKKKEGAEVDRYFDYRAGAHLYGRVR